MTIIPSTVFNLIREKFLMLSNVECRFVTVRYLKKRRREKMKIVKHLLQKCVSDVTFHCKLIWREVSAFFCVFYGSFLDIYLEPKTGYLTSYFFYLLYLVAAWYDTLVRIGLVRLDLIYTSSLNSCLSFLLMKSLYYIFAAFF